MQESILTAMGGGLPIPGEDAEGAAGAEAAAALEALRRQEVRERWCREGAGWL